MPRKDHILPSEDEASLEPAGERDFDAGEPSVTSSSPDGRRKPRAGDASGPSEQEKTKAKLDEMARENRDLRNQNAMLNKALRSMASAAGPSSSQADYAG